ncbi:lysozyme family protein [Fictibacillus gelatini]|uniref:lysozyme family protein n=1 Tax=Fictibacillus gelatini TaxID=225985 RepID=UPI0003F4E0A6|nr:lysozyme family protein [Fictibacillus gelatini]
MKRKRKKRVKTIFVMVLFIFAFFIVLKAIRSPLEVANRLNEQDSYDNVKKYEPFLRKELAKYQLQNYTPTLLAVMQQESKGKGGDPMQASESAGLKPNAIQNPEESIRRGVKHFQRALTYGKKEKVDFATVIQAYNMGIGYIDFVKKHGGKHNEQLAKQFSLIQVHKKPDQYNCGGDKHNFRYPYCYGDFTYSTKVMENIKSITASLPASKNQTDGSF